MGANRLLQVLVCLLLLGQVHLLFSGSPEGSGNIFPFVDYPQPLEWYIFGLGNKIEMAFTFFLLWRYAHKSSLQEGMVVLIFAMFKAKEIPDYLLFANQLPGLYDVVCLLLLGAGLYIIRLWSNRPSYS